MVRLECREFDQNLILRFTIKGGSHGLVVMGEDSCPESHGFESRHHVPDIFHKYLL